jgi:hypothetical protein
MFSSGLASPGWHRKYASLGAAVLAVVGSWSVALSAAAASPQLSVTASTSTIVGLQVFANVNLSGGSHPSGNLTFRLFGPNDPSCVSALFTSTVPVSGPSINSARYTATAAGTYRWEASYSGDGSNSPSGPTACAQPSAAVVVSRAVTSLAVTAAAPAGPTVHATAALGGGYHPTGTVTFVLSPPGDTFCSKTVFSSTVAVNGDGSYSSPTYRPAATGTYKWRASYSGDANSAGGTITACLTPGAAVTVSSVSAPPPPPPPAATTPTRPTSPPTSAPHSPPNTITAAPSTAAPATAAPATAPPTAAAARSLPAAAPAPSTAAAATGLKSGAGLAVAKHVGYRHAGNGWAVALAAGTAALGLSGAVLIRRRNKRLTP